MAVSGSFCAARGVWRAKPAQAEQGSACGRYRPQTPRAAQNETFLSLDLLGREGAVRRAAMSGRQSLPWAEQGSARRPQAADIAALRTAPSLLTLIYKGPSCGSRRTAPYKSE